MHATGRCKWECDLLSSLSFKFPLTPSPRRPWKFIWQLLQGTIAFLQARVCISSSEPRAILVRFMGASPSNAPKSLSAWERVLRRKVPVDPCRSDFTDLEISTDVAEAIMRCPKSLLAANTCMWRYVYHDLYRDSFPLIPKVWPRLFR